MIKAGERAPEFTLPDDAGKDRSLTELLSAGALVLYFYPADFTPGCTREACDLRDMHSEIERAGLLEVLAQESAKGRRGRPPKRYAKRRSHIWTLARKLAEEG